MLRADLQNDVVLADGPDELPPFTDRVGQRLLDVNVFSGLGRVDRDQGVRVVGSADGHEVDIVAGQHLAVIGVGLNLVLFAQFFLVDPDEFVAVFFGPE